ncbi:hypothetical protein ACPV5R_06080 [Vibrio astriarenae]
MKIKALAPAKLTIAILLAGVLVGCTSNPRYFGTPAQKTLLNGESFEKYDLSKDKKYQHSDAMQLTHLMTRQSVKNANDLDRNADGYKNADVRVTQAATVTGAATSALNPFQAAFRVVGMQGSISKMDSYYRKNMLFAVVPLSSTDEKFVEKLLRDTQNELSSIIKNAYLETDEVSDVRVLRPIDIGLSTGNANSWVIPMNSRGDVQFCADKNLNRQINDVLSDPDFKPNRYLPFTPIDCYGSVDAYGHYYKNSSTKSQFVPSSDFILVATRLPDIFPHQHLNTSNPNVYYYQPALGYLEGRNLKAQIRADINSVKPYWDAGYFDASPSVTQISSTNKLEFGTN